MFKRLFVVVLFMILSATILPEVVKADAYKYENINEVVDSVASVIDKKNAYTFKYKIDRSDYIVDLKTTVNWKNKTVTFNGFIFRAETVFKKEKFYGVLNLKNNKVKTDSKSYKKGSDIFNYVIGVWNLEKNSEYAKSLGHYLLGVFSVIGEETTVNESGNGAVLNRVWEANGTTYYSAIMFNNSKVLKMKGYSKGNVIKIEMK